MPRTITTQMMPTMAIELTMSGGVRSVCPIAVVRISAVLKGVTEKMNVEQKVNENQNAVLETGQNK